MVLLSFPTTPLTKSFGKELWPQRDMIYLFSEGRRKNRVPLFLKSYEVIIYMNTKVSNNYFVSIKFSASTPDFQFNSNQIHLLYKPINDSGTRGHFVTLVPSYNSGWVLQVSKSKSTKTIDLTRQPLSIPREGTSHIQGIYDR